MGVSLQRVQSKFACIIGELCNEPEILSQFTIWVDLRISEYKANGTIALDCSGMCPNPAWLGGFKPVSERVVKKTNIIGELPARRESFNSENLHQRRSGSNTSPFLISSDGGSDDDFDWDDEFRRSSRSIHGKSPPKAFIEQRKRVSSGFALGDKNCRQVISSPSDSGLGSTPSKLQRFEPKAKWNMDGLAPKCTPASPALPQPINESLISIIQDENDDLADLSDASIILDDFDEEFTPRYGTEVRGSINGSPAAASGARRKSGSQRSLDDGEVEPEGLSNFQIRTRVNTEGKTEQSIRNIIHSVSAFQRWIWKKANDLRHLETMPVSLLSMYLSDFFANLKKPNGKNYGAVGFANIRTQIERFLSEKQYPYSITVSPEFRTVREIFEKRRQHLRKRKKQAKVKEDSSSAEEQDPVWSDIDQEEPDLSIKQVLLLDDPLAELITKETQTLT